MESVKVGHKRAGNDNSALLSRPGLGLDAQSRVLVPSDGRRLAHRLVHGNVPKRSVFP
jgi:hypothetical protein